MPTDLYYVYQTTTEYSQLSRKRPHLVREKVVAYERWSFTEKINKKSPKLHRSINNNYYIKILPH